MKCPSGELLTKKAELKEHTVKHYKNVLRNRPINDKLSNHKKEKEDLCKMRLQEAKLNKTADWSKDDVVAVLKCLKNKKSRDPNQYANEVFDPEVAGEDLVMAVVALMNRIKRDQIYPKCMQSCNITSLYKQKGPRNEFDSYRGIFRVQVLRNILERLIYNDEYGTVDSNRL